jgi:hypothetical protein
MKKIYIVLLALSLFTLGAKAQFSYGLKAGVNIAEEHFGDDPSAASAFGSFNVGGFINYKTVTPIAVQFEIFYSGEGTNSKSPSPGNATLTYYDDIRMGFLNIPLLAQYKTNFGLYAETGPQLGLLLSSKETYDGTNSSDKQYDHSTTFSWCFGAGYELLTGPVKGLGLNIRYTLGLARIDKNEAGVGAGSILNRVLGIDLTYRLPIMDKMKR